MGLLDQIQGSGVVEQLSKKLGISPEQATKVLSEIVPRLRSNLLGKIGIGGGESLAPLVAQIQQEIAKRTAAIDLDDDDAPAKAQGLLGSALPDDEQDRTAEEIARAAGVSPDVVRKIMPHAAILTARGLEADGQLGGKKGS